jgi:hypothetical protein
MKKSILLAAVASVFGIATIAQAAPAEGKQWELTLSGQGANDNDFNGASAGINFQLGYYLDQAGQHEVSLRQGFNWSDSFGPGSSMDGSTAIVYDYHFDLGADQPIVPFVGASIGYTYGDSTDDSIIAGLEGGAKYYVNTTTFIYGRVGYDFLLKESFGDGAFNYGLGIGFRW